MAADGRIPLLMRADSECSLSGGKGVKAGAVQAGEGQGRVPNWDKDRIRPSVTDTYAEIVSEIAL